MNYEDILASLTPTVDKDPKPKEVSKERLTVVANRMALNGYQHTPKSLEALHAYLQGYGVFLSGTVGTGKTLFFRLLGVTVLDMTTFAGMRDEDAIALIHNYQNEEIVLDDIGREPCSPWTKQEYINGILEARSRSRFPTHFTTNFDEQRMLARYNDVRVVDRLYQFAKMFRFEGESKRHAIVKYGDSR